MDEARAGLCSRLFAETDLDGVYSHGINRFQRFVEQIRQGVVDVDVEPYLVSGSGCMERWDAGGGVGNLAAYLSMGRAIELAGDHGVGLVALGNTNHWMRGGTYGWQTADAGVVGMCWTNTMPNLPPWGSSEPRIGNNPLVLAVPREGGHVVLDSAMSMFSYGALASYRSCGEMLPVDGGYDPEGNLTRNPAEIEASGRPLPMGFWKGSGLSIVLDLVGALLSGGRATHEITPDPIRESSLSQVFIAIDPQGMYGSSHEEESVADRLLEHLHSSTPAPGHDGVSYPGERTLATREENRELGIPVDPEVWRAVQTM
jgi:3-dehydro-L-gulonate 2-dehydrogenase